jgi:hypothetical protein
MVCKRGPLALEGLVDAERRRIESASMSRGGATYYAKIGGGGEVHESSVIYEGHFQRKPKVNKSRTKRGWWNDD